MAVEKQVNIKVTETGLDETNKDLQSLDKNLNKVDSEAKKADGGLKKVGDNGGAIATLDALTGGLASRVRDAAEASKLFNFSLKGMRTALIATGIGAFVVAIGAVVAYWDEIVEFITGANAALEKQIELNNDNLKVLDFELKLLEEKEKILIAEGKSTAEIKKQKKAIILLQQEENALLLDRLKTQLQTEKGLANQVTLWERIKGFATRGAAGGRKSGTGDISQEEKTRLDEITKQIQDATIRTETLKLALLNLDKPEAGNGSPAGDVIQERDTSSVGSLESKGLAEIEVLTNIGEQKARLDEALTASERNQAEARQEIARLEAEAKRQSFEGYAMALSQVSAAIGQETAFGKTVAIASSLINTYASITGQLKAFSGIPIPGYAIAQAIATAATGFAAVKNITSVKVPGGDGSSGSIPRTDGGGGAVSAPSFNVVGTSGVNQLAQTLGQQDEPLRAYVVSTEMSTRQALDRNIEQTATIG